MSRAADQCVMTNSPRADLGGIVEHIGHDLRTLASDELELGRVAIVEKVETIAAEAGIAVLAATVALIGFAMLCVTAAIALAPVIPPLWARMLIMAVVYIAVGASVAFMLARRIRKPVAEAVEPPIEEARQTVHAIQRGLAR